MLIEDFDQYLFQYTDSELSHLNDPTHSLSKRYKAIPTIEYEGRTIYQFHFGSILKNHLLCVHKESRFTYIPEHIHTTIELLYVYSGNCTQVIHGKKIKMQQGDICLLDTNTPHSIEYLNQNDIIITIEMRKEYLTDGFLLKLGDAGIITSFLMNSLSKESTHNKYLLFTKVNPSIHQIIKTILFESYFPSICSEQVIDSSIMLLYCNLLREFHNESKENIDTNKKKIVSVLKYIEENYVDATLEETAEHLGYHPNYLSSFITKMTGKTFKELIIAQRLSQACSYLKSTNLSISEISQNVGYINQGFFYRKFYEQYHMTPADYRKIYRNTSPDH